MANVGLLLIARGKLVDIAAADATIFNFNKHVVGRESRLSDLGHRNLFEFELSAWILNQRFHRFSHSVLLR